MSNPYQILNFSEEEKKIQTLILSANFLTDPGILNGKMGAVLFFFNQFRRTGDSLYEDFAFELLEEIENMVTDLTPPDFAQGLCGIGWGMEFLIRERFLQANSDICASWDSLIHRFLLDRSYQGIGKDHGIGGILLYLTARIESSCCTPGSRTMNINKHYLRMALNHLGESLTEVHLKEILTEKEGDIPGGTTSLIQSRWDFPVLIHSAYRIWLHQIDPEKTKTLLSILLQPLSDSENIPRQPDNKRLLEEILLPIRNNSQLSFMKIPEP